MSVDKYPCIFSRQMAPIVYILCEYKFVCSVDMLLFIIRLEMLAAYTKVYV